MFSISKLFLLLILSAFKRKICATFVALARQLGNSLGQVLCIYFLNKILDCFFSCMFYSLFFLSSLKRAPGFHLPHPSKTMGINRVLSELGPELVSDLFGSLMTWARYFILFCNLCLICFFFFLKPNKLLFSINNYHLL